MGLTYSCYFHIYDAELLLQIINSQEPYQPLEYSL